MVDLPAYCNHRHRDHKIDRMLELKDKLTEELYNGASRGVSIESYRMPLAELRTIVLGLEALEAPLL